MKTIAFKDFMSGEYKVKEKAKRKKMVKRTINAASSISIPLLLSGSVGAVGLVMTGAKAFATTSVVPTGEAVPVSAKEWMGEQTLSMLAHVLDPVVDILVALSFPVASVVIVGACFFFMFGNAEKAWGMIQNAGLGYVLIQVSPLILNVLKQVGNAV
jgi:Type IV secretion system pilin